MGSVYRAKDKILKRYVALKRLLPSLGDGETERKRLEREARVGMVLRHPNIVPVHDLITFDNELIVVMELVEGQTLRQRLEEGNLSSNGLVLLIGLVDALEEAHDKGVIHRDLKPENVLIGKDGVPKVGDWGLTKSETDTTGLTKTGIIVGTPRYMAPEQILGRQLTTAVDMYAFGVMVFEVLTGHSPFMDGSLSDLLKAHLDGKPRKLGQFILGVSPDLEQLVARLLANEPKERPSAKETKDVLRKALALDGLSKPTSAPVKTSIVDEKTEKRSTRLFWSSVSLVIILLCLLLARGRKRNVISTDDMNVAKRRRDFEMSLDRFIKGNQRQLTNDLIKCARDTDTLLLLEAVISHSLETQSYYRANEDIEKEETKLRMYKIAALIELLQRRLRPNKPRAEVDELAVAMADHLITAIIVISSSVNKNAKKNFYNNISKKNSLNSIDRLLYEFRRDLYLITTSRLSGWSEKGQLHPALELLNIFLQNKYNLDTRVLELGDRLRSRLMCPPWKDSPTVPTIISHLFKVEVDAVDKQLKRKELLAYAPLIRKHIIHVLPELNTTGPLAFKNVALVKSCEAYQIIFDRLLGETASAEDTAMALQECNNFLDATSKLPKKQIFAFNYIYRYSASNKKKRGALLDLLQENWTKNGRGHVPEIRLSIKPGPVVEGKATDADCDGKPVTLWGYCEQMELGIIKTKEDGSFRFELLPKPQGLSDRALHIAVQDFPNDELNVFVYYSRITE